MRSICLALLVATVSLLARAAHADDRYSVDPNIAPIAPGQLGPTQLGPPKDRRRFMFELKFGPYKPDVDGELSNGRTPYRDTFGNGQNLMTQLEFDVELWHGFGTLAIGGTWGLSKVTAQAFALTGERAADETSFTIMPLVFQLVYRFDILAERHGIPFVPYAKFGLDWYLYWISDGNGDTAQCNDPKACKPLDGVNSGKGQGGVFGYQFVLGGAILLDFIDRNTARSAKAELGLSHTYLFGEFLYADISNFHAGNALHLGATTFLVGLAFEF